MTLYRITTRFDGLPGAPFFNTLFFDDLAGSAAQAASAVGSFWTSLATLQSSQLSFEVQPEVPSINQTNGEVVSLSVVNGATGTGADTTEQGPTVLQGLIQWRTGIPFDGRILRGRTFVPGLSVQMQDNGRVAQNAIDGMLTTAQVLIDAANADLSIWHRPRPADPDADPPVTFREGAQADVGVVSVSPEWAVLRSRRD